MGAYVVGAYVVGAFVVVFRVLDILADAYYRQLHAHVLLATATAFALRYTTPHTHCTYICIGNSR